MLERIWHNLGWVRTPFTQHGESHLRDGRARIPAAPHPARVSPVTPPANGAAGIHALICGPVARGAAGIRALPRVLTGRIGVLKYVATALIAVLAIGEVGAVSTAPINPAFKEWQRRKSDVSASEKKSGEENARGRRLLSVNSGVEERRLLGHVPSLVDYSYLKNINYQQVAQAATVTFPARFDLRDEGMLTSVKNQGAWGTCWAHATIGSLESGVLMGGGASLDLSEWHLANTHGFDYSTKNGDGGNGDMAIAYLTRWSGPIAESQDPYPSVYRDSPAGTPVGHVQNVKILTPMSTAFDTDEIKKTLMEHGSIYAGYLHLWAAESSDEKSYYWNGDTSMYQSQRDGGGHAVQIVGWDDNYSKSHFRQSPPGNGAFICKNSWGTSYGENGYFYVSYYDAMFGADELYSFFDLQDVKNYDGIYQYDPLGHVNNCGGTSPCWGANIFRCGKDNEEIAAVGFYSLVKNTKYVVEIYTDCTDSKPTSGNRQVSQSGTCDFVGYVTVPLNSSVQIKNGRLFSVVVKLTTPGYSYPLAYEAYFSYQQNGKTYWTPTSEATASVGQSFMSQNGTSWMDFTTAIHPTANFCCKAYTKSASAPAKTLSSLAITGVNSLQSGKTAQFTCKAKYSDNSDADVTSNAGTRWSIASGSAYASVSSAGLVTAKSVTQQQTVKVHADYTEGGVTKSDDWSFYVTVQPPDPPTDLIASQGTDASCVRVTWTAPSGASSYSVYRSSTTSSANAQYQNTVTVPKYNDNDAEPGVKYTYFVKAKNDSGMSTYSAGAQGWKALSAPEGVTASDGTSLNAVEISWTAAPGAKYYRVYRAEDLDGEKTALGSWQTETSFRDTMATPAGKVYYYYVASAIDSRGNMASDFSIFDDGYIGVPVTLDAITINGSASIPSGGTATYTCTAIMTDKTTKNVSPTWSVTAGSSYVTRSGATLTAKTVTANQSVTLQASYTEGGVTRMTNKVVTITAVKPAAPATVTLTGATANGISISWSSVVAASSYNIWRSVAGGEAEKIGSSSTTSFTDDRAQPGVSCVYTVSAVNAAGESAPSSASATGLVPLAAPTGVTASNGTSTDKVALSWTAVTGATHYRVFRATSQTGTKTALGSWQPGTTYNDTSATAGTTYWYFIQAATSSSGANPSAYSAGVQGQRKVTVTLVSLTINGPDRMPSGRTETFSCMANYSNGSSKPVTPTWSASAGSITSGGAYTAPTVTANRTVTITARFTDGTQVTGTKQVTVVAPIIAGAQVTRVVATPRWPWNALLDIDYDLETTPSGTRATVSVSGYDHDHDVPLAATTLTGDGANGALVAAGNHRITWNIGADYPNFHAKNFTVNMTAVPSAVAAPTNVTVSAGTSTQGVDITWARVDEATNYEVWRGTTDSTNTAQRIKTTNQLTYSDTDAVAGMTYYYWVKSVNEDGTSDFGRAVSGWRAYADITVTFNGNGGTPSYGSNTYSPTKAYNTLPTASRTGYQFDGWYTASSGGTQVTTSSTVPTTATTLYAHWTANTYTISFNANGGSGSMGSLAITYDVAKNLTANAFTRSNYQFAGWATSAGGAVVYANGASVKNLTTSNGATVTLYAKWLDLSAPTSVTASDGTINEGVSVSWTPTPSATSYEIYRDNVLIGTATETNYLDRTATAAIKYAYAVKGRVGGYVSDLSSSDEGYVGFNMTATYMTTFGGVELNLNGMTNVTYVYRSQYADGRNASAIMRYSTSRDEDQHITLYHYIENLTADYSVEKGVDYYYWCKRSDGLRSKTVKGGCKRLSLTGKYVIIDMSAGRTALNFPVIQQSSEPTNITSDDYLSKKIVLRRVEPGTFMMGDPSGKDLCADYHQVTLTKAYYMGVFQMRAAQIVNVSTNSLGYLIGYGHARCSGYWPDYFNTTLEERKSEVEELVLSGYAAHTYLGFHDYEMDYVFLSSLVTKTGLSSLGLPTDAEWEYACRAGTTTAYNNGQNSMQMVTNTYSRAGRIAVEYQSSARRNNWGLYDMNCSYCGEWVRDGFISHLGTTPVEDPLQTWTDEIPADWLARNPGDTYNYGWIGGNVIRGGGTRVWSANSPAGALKPSYYRNKTWAWPQFGCDVTYRPFCYAGEQ